MRRSTPKPFGRHTGRHGFRGGVGIAACLLFAPDAAAAATRLPLDRAYWRIEAEDPTTKVSHRGNVIDIDTSKGLTLWFERRLAMPLTIRFEARAVAAGGTNDRVSDLNAFWMAQEADGSSPVGRRQGRFEQYDTLLSYYIGIGGNRNTTTRLRRYVGRVGERPLLPAHDRAEPAAMLVPNRWTRITLTADGSRIVVKRDGRSLFTMHDVASYRAGWFGLRTTWSHLQIRDVTVTTR